MARWRSLLAASLAFAVLEASAFARPPRAPKNEQSGPSSTAPPPADIDYAEKQYAALDYEGANRAADRVLAQHGLSHDQLVRACRILALTHAALGHADEAREAFVELLTYNPDFTADTNLGPRVVEPFLEARGYWRGVRVKPGLEVDVKLTANEVGVLHITTRDPTHVADDVILGFRWGATSAYQLKPVAIGEGVVVETSVPPEGATRLDYYVQAFDKHDSTVFEVGNPASPKSATVAVPPPPPPPPPAEKKSILKSPLFWGVIVAAVGGGATGAYFLFRPKEPTSASLGGGAACGDVPCH